MDLRYSPANQNVYILAVYHLEMERVSTESLAFIFSYLRDDRVYNTPVYTLLEAVAEQVCF